MAIGTASLQKGGFKQPAFTKGEFVSLFGRNKEATTEKSDVDVRKQYAEDFKAFMEKSHLQFFRQDIVGEIIYIGYLIRKPNQSGIWLYVLVGSGMIAAGLRVLSPKHIDILEKQKKDIQAYFNEELDWRGNGVGISRFGTDLMDVSDRNEQFYFLRKTLETLDFVFRDRVDKLD
ncbi:hypothetical protein F4X10_04290 [Candidatus Poribacteria bacterium]|nr:hypothetical protein [Candidatus Poribacteria bacterium]